jgi:hypothetical protein
LNSHWIGILDYLGADPLNPIEILSQKRGLRVDVGQT